jgi:hypothetical protein
VADERDPYEQHWQSLLDAAQLAAIAAMVDGDDAAAQLAHRNAILVRVAWALAEKLAAAEMKLAAIAEVVDAAERADRVVTKRNN